MAGRTRRDNAGTSRTRFALGSRSAATMDTSRRSLSYTVALALLAAGALAVALAALPYKTFDLDRFFVPKELVLHAAAALTALVLLWRAPRLELTRIDTLLVAFLGLSLLSAVLSTNWWLAWRALAVSLSGVAVFWCAGAVARGGRRDALVSWLVLGVVAACVTALLQAYGVQSDYVSLNRAPGGTLGNRNFVAHLAAIATPALLWRTLGARTTWGARAGTAGVMVLAAILTLSRTRAAWLALAVCVPIAVIGVIAGHRTWRRSTAAARSGRLAAALGATVLAAMFVPNKLNWKSDSPYLDSVRGVVDYRAGSGKGRLVQYKNSLRLASAHPVLGVGPGNWSVRYPSVATPNDPSIDADDGMTANPWPSSDWMADLAERGAPAAACLGVVFIGLYVTGLMAMSPRAGSDEFAQGLVLVVTTVIVVVAGSFDALLLLPAPALIVWGLLGALAVPSRTRVSIDLTAGRRAAALALVLALGVAAAGRSAAQAVAMQLVERDGRTVAMERAASLDPGSYPIQMRLATLDARRGRCDGVRQHAGAAHELFPAAP
ncbi:MAG TPA: O-antigen ligase family protein, partial [Gemmatimonadaceae bacterium]|nr:O-antigen ligase family protein [Gemmatimonadaceae bacterium]